MAGLIDIAPLTETVEVRGQKATVSGLSVQGLAALLFRFPDLSRMWATSKWDMGALLAMSDDILAAIIAAGVAELDEARAANLALDEKAELLGAIVKVTMPRGPIPFMAALTKLMGSGGSGDDVKAPALKSLLRSKR
jgi:hypothetical protein